MDVYLNNAATSWPKPESVYQAVDNYLRHYGASQGRGGFRRSLEATGIIETCRSKLAELFHTSDPSRFVFTKNCSEALNLAIKGVLHRGDHVITTSMEHNSVWRPLKTLEQKGSITLTQVICHPSGEINLSAVQKAFQPRTRLLVCTHASNVTGTIFPLAELSEIAHAHQAIFLVDAAQTAGSHPIEIDTLGIDLLAFPGHKGLLGPQGTGALYISPRLMLDTLLEGGTGSSSLSPYQPDLLPGRFETGTPNGPGIAGLGAAVDFILKTGIDEIRQKEHLLTGILLENLQRIPGVTIYGPQNPDLQVGVVSFNLLDVNPVEVGTVLDEVYQVMVRTGLHCAPQAHQTIGTIERGTVRVSPSFFNTQDEIHYFIEAMQKIAKKTRHTVQREKSASGDFVTGYKIQRASPCYSDGKKLRVVASFPREIDELFPYLNAVLRGDYSQEGKTFTFSYDGRPVVLQSGQMILGKTEDVNTAQEVFTAVIKMLNNVAAKRDIIKPTNNPQIQLSPYSFYKHLPRTNCKECGELTCLAFAVGVIQGRYRLEKCPVLQEPLYKSQKKAIEKRLADFFEGLLPTGDEFFKDASCLDGKK